MKKIKCVINLPFCQHPPFEEIAEISDDATQFEIEVYAHDIIEEMMANLCEDNYWEIIEEEN